MWIAGVLVLCLTNIPWVHSAAGSWGYVSGVNDISTVSWPADACTTGAKQTPIDLIDAQYVDDWLPFIFSHYQRKPYKMKLSNNGHSAKVSMEPEGCDDNMPKLNQGGLGETYEFDSLHFHWGWYHKPGSEHLIDGKRYPAEVHFVHYKISCGRTLGEAATNCPADPDVIAVLGVMLEVGHDKNDAYDNILSELHRVISEGDSVDIKPVSLKYLLPYDTNEFFRYDGSLTTPEPAIGGIACTQAVKWTVFKNPVKIAKYQLEEFYKLTTDTGDTPGLPLRDNYKPISPLGGRLLQFANLELKDPKNPTHWRDEAVCGISIRETDKKLNFKDAQAACVSSDYKDGPYMGLMPLGKLRCLKNRFGTSKKVIEKHFSKRYYRINAIKDEFNVWREYGGQRIMSFAHFPEFRPHHGGPGDTLIWDALQNDLYIENRRDDQHALCFHEEPKECHQCPGWEVGRECSNAGDCSKVDQEADCDCDEGFDGKSCQVAPVPDVDIVVTGGDGESSFLTETFDTASKQVCEISSFHEFTGGASSGGVLFGAMCDTVFGKGICCGGAISSTFDLSNDCGFYDCFAHQWAMVHDMKFKVYDLNPAVIRNEQGRDIGWFFAGGAAEHTTPDDKVGTRKVQMLKEDLTWDTINTETPVEIYGHCTVQINDCEVALIGGNVGPLPATPSDKIYIYNLKSNTWRDRPMVKQFLNPSCAKIMEKTTSESKILFGCGSTGGADEPNVYEWELSSDRINVVNEGICGPPSGAAGRFKKMDENTVVIVHTTGKINRISSSNVLEQLNPSGEDLSNTGGTSVYDYDFFILDRKTTMCSPPPVPPPAPSGPPAAPGGPPAAPGGPPAAPGGPPAAPGGPD